MEYATGYYLNVYGRDVDVFVIFNEANDEPTAEEISTLVWLVEDAIDNGNIADNSPDAFRRELVTRIEETELNCVRFGVQVILTL